MTPEERSAAVTEETGAPGRIQSRLTGWLDSLDRVELVATTVLALAAIATAWSGFQSSKWSGEQSILFSEASAARTESTRASTTAGQLAQIDVGMYGAWLEALDTDVRSGAVEIAADRPYVPESDTLSGFLFARFRDEFTVAVEAWLATGPLNDPAAPTSPFVMPEYALEAAAQADTLLVQAEQKAADARRANQNSDNYVLTGVLFALVLFFAGISSKLQRRRNRSIMMALAILGLVAGIATVLLLPIYAVF